MDVKDGDLENCLDEKIDDGRKLVERLKIIRSKVDGVDKLVKKINQEIRFLVKVQSTGTAKKECLQSTNLIHLTAMVQRLFVANEPVCVMRPFKQKDSQRLEVDIVCDGGASWVKVIARNARALTLISLGNGEYGQKSVVDQAKSYLKCASFHPHRYKRPQIIFHFAGGVQVPLSKRLEDLGIVVEGTIVRSEKDSVVKTETLTNLMNESYDYRNGSAVDQSSNVDSEDIGRLNLDVSTLLGYVSNMTNGHANFVYREPLLTGQAEWERNRPVKPILDKLFEGKQLFVCETAYKNFMDIVSLVGGPNEMMRAKELVERIKIVDDAKQGRILERLSLRGNIKNRSRLVFATGESTKSITVSANERFVRAARTQGIECTVVLHEPRSLSELKERYATPIETT